MQSLNCKALSYQYVCFVNSGYLNGLQISLLKDSQIIIFWNFQKWQVLNLQLIYLKVYKKPSR